MISTGSQNSENESRNIKDAENNKRICTSDESDKAMRPYYSSGSSVFWIKKLSIQKNLNNI